MRCKRPSYLGGIRSGMQRLSSRGLARALQQEVEQFAMIQKSEYGFDLLDALGKRALKLIGVTPNLWILPEGMKMYLNLVRKENFQVSCGRAAQAWAFLVKPPALHRRRCWRATTATWRRWALARRVRNCSGPFSFLSGHQVCP
jgi:hypothetical protein